MPQIRAQREAPVAQASRPQIEKIVCAQCWQLTNHTLLHTYKSRGDDEESGISWGARYEFFKCNGCEEATYRRISWFSEDDGELDITFYPPRNESPPYAPKQFGHIWGSPLDSVYRQTISALNNQLLTLTGAGVRLIIEGVCNERGIKNGLVTDEKGTTKRKETLQGRINGLAEKGFITSQQAETLHEIRFLGNDAAHELDQPSATTVTTAIDIVEHLLEQVYEQPEKAKKLAARKRPTK